MKRRNFFKSIGAAVLGCYLGLGVKPLKVVEEDLYKELPYYVIDIEGLVHLQVVDLILT